MLLQYKSATSARAGTDGQQTINNNSIAGNKKYSAATTEFSIF